MMNIRHEYFSRVGEMFSFILVQQHSRHFNKSYFNNNKQTTYKTNNRFIDNVYIPSGTCSVHTPEFFVTSHKGLKGLPDGRNNKYFDDNA